MAFFNARLVASRDVLGFNSLPAKVSSADNLSKQFAPRSGPTRCRA